MELLDYWDKEPYKIEARSKLQEHILIAYQEIEYLHLNEVVKTIASNINLDGTILDIGAGEKLLKKPLSQLGFKGKYYSMDVSKKYEHDFHSLDEINQQFDSVMILEVIEHLEIKDTIALLQRATELLKNGGKIIVSTPNASHINHIWQGEMTHIQQYPYRDIYALLRLLGFGDDALIYKIFIRPYKWSLRRTFKFVLKKILLRILDVDYAQDLIVIARKPDEKNNEKNKNIEG